MAVFGTQGVKAVQDNELRVVIGFLLYKSDVAGRRS